MTAVEQDFTSESTVRLETASKHECHSFDVEGGERKGSPSHLMFGKEINWRTSRKAVKGKAACNGLGAIY